MRITFVLPTVGMSGGIRVVAIYARELMRRGHQVTLISPPPKSATFWQRLRGRHSDGPAPGSFLDDGVFDHRVLDHWRPVIDEDVPESDVVIATWWETAEWVNALSRNKGAKVYFIQGHEIFPYLPVDRCRATYRFPMHKIVVSRWLREIMLSAYGDGCVDLVPNSVDRSLFFPMPRGKQPIPTVGALYSTTSVKGIDLSLKAIAQVREKFPQLRACFFGSERPVPHLALPEYAEFRYRPRQEDIRGLYSSCDVWITASRNEGFNLPAMEAMACATPVVSTRTGWPEEAIKSQWNGVLVDVDDIDGLTQGLEWILSCNEQAWGALSANAQLTASKGSWEQSSILFETALRNAVVRYAH